MISAYITSLKPRRHKNATKKNQKENIARVCTKRKAVENPSKYLQIDN